MARPAPNWTGPCQHCGQTFSRYAPPSQVRPQFCSQVCRGKSLGKMERSPEYRAKLGRPRERHHLWKGDAVAPKGGRARALRWHKLKACEACGDPNAERHHRNANTADNTEGNIQFLCRRCHMTEDGRIFNMQQVRYGQSADRRA